MALSTLRIVSYNVNGLRAAMNKGLIDEIGSPGFYNSSLYEYLPIFRADAQAVPDCVRVASSELLLSGVTTVVQVFTTLKLELKISASSL